MESPATFMSTGAKVNGGSGTPLTIGATRTASRSGTSGGLLKSNRTGPTGLFQLAFILDDARLKGIARELVDRCLAGQTADGYIGGWPEKPYSNEGDLYTQSLLLKALISYQRATNDPRIVPAMQRALRHIKTPLPSGDRQCHFPCLERRIVRVAVRQPYHPLDPLGLLENG